MDSQTEKANAEASSYTVVARRYRPKSFAELIGQDHIAHALGAAIDMGRVGHAYLFTGARGVGKTSTARIFAKVLNTSQVAEALADDISHAIEIGEDMDVIEIDGASNRGIEEIRQLRANVNVRPSRARYKIYIIDEVHMLTSQAFNALLKTLEEPPSHVKFIFCTTDPDKIPITVLSRCQRFDFVPVKLDAIQARLKEICQAEGYTAADDALALLARRAAGSLRDSQSLLEQVMSFSSETITVSQVHQLLGIADEGRLLDLSETLARQDALAAIELVDEAMRGGADAGQLAEQMLNYLRDLMAVGVGGGPALLKHANPAGHARLKEIVAVWGVQSVLCAIQILDESLVRMRSSISASALLEVALVQICQLENLASIPALLEAVMEKSGNAGASRSIPASEKKNSLERPVTSPAQLPTPEIERQAEPSRGNRISSDDASNRHPPADSVAAHHPSMVAEAVVSPTAVVESQEAEPIQDGTRALECWKKAIGGIDDMLADFASWATMVNPVARDHWNVVFPPGAGKSRDYCDQSDRKATLQAALQNCAGSSIRLTFSVQPGEAPRSTPTAPASSNRAQKLREVAENPFVKKLCEVLEGDIIRVDPPAQPSLPEPKNAANKQV